MVRLYPNPGAVRERYGDKMGEVIKAMKENEPVILEAFRGGRQEVAVGPYVVTRDMVFIKSEKRKTDLEKFIPHVVEPSFGLDRIFYVLLESAVVEEEGRVYLRLPPDVAPVNVCILPIVKRKDYAEIGRRLVRRLAAAGFSVVYDDEGTIGSRYASCDEIGTPLAVTIDEKTPVDGTVTIRDRDTKRQVRVGIDGVAAFVDMVKRGASFSEAAEALKAAPV